ncbi:MAG: ABC transporter related [Thermotogales bacterium 46_20]|nr:MAG: ABC transporter related [Thermotogales bacterium 46_20]
MIQLENITKVYSGSVKAVNNVSLQVKAGEIFGFLGPNGAGKTTTIKMIVGLLQPTSGSIKLFGENMSPENTALKKKIGYVADEPLVMEKLTGVEYIKFICDVFDVPVSLRATKTEQLLKTFKLESAIRDPVSTYSHGMRQKLSLICALVHDPDLWILDEPIVGLDPKSAFLLKQMMREHADAGNTVFFSTHIMEIAERVCDRLGIIGDGELKFVGTVQELRELRGEGSLEKLFLEVTAGEDEESDFSYLGTR